MNRFNSLLLPLDGSAEAAKGAGCAMWLANALGATLHVLHVTPQPLPGPEALERLRIDNIDRDRIIVHQLFGNAATAVVEAIEEHHISLVIMSACGQSTSTDCAQHRRLGTVAQAVIEHCPIPVLLLPVHYREDLPWTSMLAAASGEVSADNALEAAVQLATALHIKVTIVHSEFNPLANYVDTAHHEYPHRLDAMIKRGLAGCIDTECQSVDQVLLRQGEPTSVLLQQLEDQHSSVLALGWRGVFDTGRAPVLKRLLETASCPLLLVRGSNGSHTTLMVGKDIDD